MKQNRLTLNDVEWREFFIGGDEGLFKISATKSGIDKNKLNINQGDIPYITRSDLDNGINMFITDNQNIKYKVNKGNVITIGLDTQTVFYQSNDFFTGQNIQVLENENLNKNISMFLIPLLKKQMEKFNWGGNGATLTRLNRTRILLPIDSNRNPNWEFMENYVKQEQKEIAQKVINYYEQKILETGFDLLGLEDVEWKQFKVRDIFNVESVKGKPISNYDYGTTAYVTTSNQNNGVKTFVKSKDSISSKGAISVDPIAGKAFYHDYDFIGRGGAGSAISLLYNDYVDKYIGHFICTMIEKISKEKASYGLALNGERLKNSKVKLPVDRNGNPYWDYMSKFMQKIEAEKIEKALEYIYSYIYIYIYELAILRGLQLQSLEEKEWKEFWLEDIVSVSSGVRLTKANQEKGSRPFIGSSDSNNGVTEFVNNTNTSLDSNVLGVNYNGSVVENFYHPYECIFSDDVKRIHWKDKEQENKYSYLFLKQAILQQKEKYAYGYKFNANRMKRQKIVLPINDEGSLDFDYMKKFMQIKEIEKQYKVLEYYYGLLKA